MRIHIFYLVVAFVLLIHKHPHSIHYADASPARNKMTSSGGLGGFGGLSGYSGLGVASGNTNGGGGMSGAGPGSAGGTGSRRSCKPGTFYQDPDFFAYITNDFIYDHPNSFITASQHCAAVLLSHSMLREICACDCFQSHGASESEVCVIDLENLKEAPIGCACLYSDEDYKRLPCLDKKVSGGGGGGGGSRPAKPKDSDDLESTLTLAEASSELGRSIGGGRSRVAECRRMDSPTERDTCMENVCRPVFQSVKILACSEQDMTIPDHDGAIKGTDLCSIDCFYVHGARTAPYGIYGMGGEWKGCPVAPLVFC